MISTLQALRFRVNMGAGKTEAMLEVRGTGAKKVRGDLLSGTSTLSLAPGVDLRLTPEYRYLGVVQTPRDTGRRDSELCAQRACGAWVHGRNLLASAGLPWALKVAWMSGRVLPAAYATLATSLAVSARAWSPLTGFFERAARTLVGSWQFGHVLTGPLLGAVVGLTSPEHAATIARVRLVVQITTRAPVALRSLFDDAWNRATPWCEILADSLRVVSSAVSRPCPGVATSLCFVSRHSVPLLKACRRLSRWGSLFHSVWGVWNDVVTPRRRAVLGQLQSVACHLCGHTCPSKHALAAHLHRKHSVVNVLTRYTHGTACLWCHTEHHSTDRLKYHLGRSPSCMHGLRVVVGMVYVYGTGTKRSGTRLHRGLPPLRLIGPLNASPAQRLAAAQGRECTQDELQHELRLATGSNDVYLWPDSPHTAALGPDGLSVPSTQAPSADAMPCPASCPAFEPGRWFSLVDQSDVAHQDWRTPSSLWSGLLSGDFVCQFPGSWHRYWKLWHAMHFQDAWSFQAFRDAALLRRISIVTPGCSPEACQPPSGLLDFLAATVVFRTVCQALLSRGTAWLVGAPSRLGLVLLRSLLPDAAFHTLSVGSSRLFVVDHSCSPSPVWRSGLSALFSSSSSVHAPKVLALRSSFVYHTRSPG